jgi:hypothetical protein
MIAEPIDPGFLYRVTYNRRIHLIHARNGMAAIIDLIKRAPQ